MYPKISDLINDLLGTNINLPIQSFGFMVAIAFIVAAYLLYNELRRKGKDGLIKTSYKTIIIGEKPSLKNLRWIEIIGYFIVGWKVGGLLFNYESFANDPQGYVFSMQGNIFIGLIAGVASGWMNYNKKKKEVLPKPEKKEIAVSPESHTGNIIMISIFTGLLGSKVFDAIEHWEQLLKDPIEVLLSFSGLAFFGGLFFAIIALIYYCKKHNIPFLVLADSAVPALLIAYAIGRIGCQIAGDGCWGVENLKPKPEWLTFLPDWMWAYKYPNNVINEGIVLTDCYGDHCHILENPVFPTPIYETIINTIWFIIVWSIRKKIKTTGVLFGIYLIMNGISRFLIERIRVNIRYDLVFGFNPTQAEIISVLLIISGIFLIWYLENKTRQNRKTKQNL